VLGNIVTKHTSLETVVIARGKQADLKLESYVDFDPNSISCRHAEISFSKETGMFNLKGLTTNTVYPVSDVLKAHDVFEICGVRVVFKVICADNGSTKAHGVNLSASAELEIGSPQARDVSDSMTPITTTTAAKLGDGAKQAIAIGTEIASI